MPIVLDKQGRPLAGNLREIAQRAVDKRETLRAFFPMAEVRSKRAAQIREDADDGDGAADGPIVAVINTDDVDRYRTIVDPAGAELEAFAENPIVLWQHGLDWGVGSWPVGTVVNLTRSDKEIEAEVQFDLESGLGAELDRLYRDKILRGFSIGFIPHSFVYEQIDDKEILRYTKWELVELSAVSVPANPQALARSLESIKTPELRQAVSQFGAGGRFADLIVGRKPATAGCPSAGQDAGTGQAADGFSERVTIDAGGQQLELLARNSDDARVLMQALGKAAGRDPGNAQPAGSERLEQIASAQREILELLDVRAGAQISKKNCERIQQAIDAMDGAVKQLKQIGRTFADAASSLRDLIAQAQGEDDGKPRGVGGRAGNLPSDGGPEGSGRATAPVDPQEIAGEELSRCLSTDFLREVAKGAVQEAVKGLAKKAAA